MAWKSPLGQCLTPENPDRWWYSLPPTGQIQVGPALPVLDSFHKGNIDNIPSGISDQTEREGRKEQIGLATHISMIK